MNIVNQLDKYRLLVNGYNTFIETTKENEDIWKTKKNEIENILKYFDYYMIFISSYAIYAPILNYNNRQKLKNYCLQIINKYIENSSNKSEEEKKEELDDENRINELKYIKDFNFIELMYNIFDISKAEKDLFSSSNIYNDFIKENFILMYLFKEKIPYIIDHTHYGKQILKEYLSFTKAQNIQTVNITSNSLDKNQEFKDKLLNCTNNGDILFLDEVNDIRKIYYSFYYYINNQFTGDKYKKMVVIDDNKYQIHDNFKLFIFKNAMEKSRIKLDQNIFFNMFIINFNLRKEDIKEQIFLELSKKRNELAFNSFKKIRNEIIKQSILKIETENKMISSILNLDISGNLDKFQSNESLNEKYKNECQTYSNINNVLKNCDNNYKNQKFALEKNYGNLSKHASVLFKWIFKFNLLKISYLINPDTLIKYLLEFYNEKILIQKGIKEKIKIIKGENNENNIDNEC